MAKKLAHFIITTKNIFINLTFSTSKLDFQLLLNLIFFFKIRRGFQQRSPHCSYKKNFEAVFFDHFCSTIFRTKSKLSWESNLLLRHPRIKRHTSRPFNWWRSLKIITHHIKISIRSVIKASFDWKVIFCANHSLLINSSSSQWQCLDTEEVILANK